MFDTPDRTGLIADEIHARAMAREASRKGDAEGRAYWIDRADKVSAMIDALADLAAPAYRTGVAYAWKGGECPVAPDARVVLRYRLPRDHAHAIAPRIAMLASAVNWAVPLFASFEVLPSVSEAEA
ncbi:hypothetical protein QWZ10_26195 [Paracoccus cavernae]|uniref:Uncharacterized protein n=2 Tax=Paracoccus cavernae TaxID=1571207 RepID=A0ABT8DI79_9RHOB|nr:hypothetical protein [Paracoccus cavernae]MDN3714429.1 hypothetical protein [Paracoccus cavernae]